MVPTTPLRRSLSLLLEPRALLCALLCLGATVAHACPPGTVFSAYNGNGICAYIGQGKKKAVQCTHMVNSCPPGTTHDHKTRGDTGDYCCPVVVQSCDDQCAPIKTSVTPATEAARVYSNCISFCTGRGSQICPDGRRVGIRSKC
jgi:hypothetical protein